MSMPKPLMRTLIAALIVAAVWQAPSATAQDKPAAPGAAAAPVLEAAGKVELPGYEGDFDHFEVDLKGNRLFLAAEDHNTLEVFDLKSLKHLKTINDLETPHGLLYLPDVNKLVVTQTGSDGATKVIDGASYAIVGSFKHTKGADSMVYDAPRKRLYVVAGGRDMKQASTWLVELDPYTGRNYGELKFDTDKVEAMAVEERGNKLYINVTGKNEMAVVDKKTRSVIATWPIKTQGKNAPLAFDEVARRLFVVTRGPGELLIVNADTGATVTKFKAPERCDQVLFDQAHKRIYVLGGEGYIGVFAEKDADHYEELPRIVSASGAKTGIFVPELNKLFVAASPGDTKATAAVLVYNVK
jgi:DNA-binding beta-propeller fold protein YncE